MRCRVGQQPFTFQHPARLQCDRVARLNNANQRPSQAFDERADKGIVAATQDNDICASFDDRRQAVADQRDRLLAIELSCLNELHQSRARLRNNLGIAAVLLQHLKIQCATDGGLRSEHTDDAGTRDLYRWFDRRHHTDDGDVRQAPA